jgi:MoaA/NifB/PqqE/SkfB family radical SAM enzyme
MYATDAVRADAAAFRQAVRERRAYRPLYVKIKLIYGCNLRCAMCNHWREHRPAPLPAERLREVLGDLAGLGCRKVHFTGGEPLLRPQVPDLTAHASALGIRVTMTTNGTLVDKALARRLAEAGLRGVNLSLDSPDRRTHDRVRGVRGAWKRTTRAVEHFRRAARHGKLAVRVNTVVNRATFATLAGLPDLVHSLGADQLNLIPVDDHCGRELALRRRDIERYNAEIAPRLAERALALGLFADEREAYPFGQTPRELALSRRGAYALGWYKQHPCFAPWTHSLIDYGGQVYICCMTREQIPPLGDLHQQSFSEIWTGAGYQAIRQLMHPPALSPCRRCDDFLEENRRLLEIAEADGAV